MIAISTMQLHEKPYNTGADLGGLCRGCSPPSPPEMTCGFLIQLIFCKKKKKTMWFIGVEVEQETSTPPPKKNPGSAPVILVTYICTVSLWLRVYFVISCRKLEIITAPLHHVPSIILIERGAYEKEASESLMRFVCFYALSNLFIAS